MNNYSLGFAAPFPGRWSRKRVVQFKQLITEHLGTTTELGAEAWNHAVDVGTLDPNNFSIDPNAWASFSRAKDGYLSLGVAPMPEKDKERYIYRGEGMSYKDEVTRRLLHEVTHGGVFLAQQLPSMSTLLGAAMSFRKAGSRGLTTLGSHPYYKTPEDGAIEDVVELITMRELGVEHLDGYLGILSDCRYERLREIMGLATIADVGIFKELVDNATYETLTAAA